MLKIAEGIDPKQSPFLQSLLDCFEPLGKCPTCVVRTKSGRRGIRLESTELLGEINRLRFLLNLFGLFPPITTHRVAFTEHTPKHVTLEGLELDA